MLSELSGGEHNIVRFVPKEVRSERKRPNVAGFEHRRHDLRWIYVDSALIEGFLNQMRWLGF